MPLVQFLQNKNSTIDHIWQGLSLCGQCLPLGYDLLGSTSHLSHPTHTGLYNNLSILSAHSYLRTFVLSTKILYLKYLTFSLASLQVSAEMLFREAFHQHPLKIKHTFCHSFPPYPIYFVQTCTLSQNLYFYLSMCLLCLHK